MPLFGWAYVFGILSCEQYIKTGYPASGTSAEGWNSTTLD
jgi:hypothetical protein